MLANVNLVAVKLRTPLATAVTSGYVPHRNLTSHRSKRFSRNAPELQSPYLGTVNLHKGNTSALSSFDKFEIHGDASGFVPMEEGRRLRNSDTGFYRAQISEEMQDDGLTLR